MRVKIVGSRQARLRLAGWVCATTGDGLSSVVKSTGVLLPSLVYFSRSLGLYEPDQVMGCSSGGM